MLAYFDPRLHFIQVPDDAARRQVEAARELAAALHFVDRCFGQRDDLPQFLAADGAPEGKWVLLRKLRQRPVGFRSRQRERVGFFLYLFHLGLHECAAWRHGEVQYLSVQLAMA